MEGVVSCIVSIRKRSNLNKLSNLNFSVDLNNKKDYINKMKNKIEEFNNREYIENNYSKKVLENYEEDFGLNGLDYLWSLENKEEIDEVLESYL